MEIVLNPVAYPQDIRQTKHSIELSILLNSRNSSSMHNNRTVASQVLNTANWRHLSERMHNVDERK